MAEDVVKADVTPLASACPHCGKKSIHANAVCIAELKARLMATNQTIPQLRDILEEAHIKLMAVLAVLKQMEESAKDYK